jgi:hypothetical protein
MESEPASDLHQRLLRTLDRADRELRRSHALVAQEQELHEALASTLAETKRARAARERARPRP